MDRRIYRASVALAVTALPLAGFYPIANIDPFGHLAQGRYHASHGLGTADPFGFAHDGTKPWCNYEWLFDLGLWRLYTIGGLDALTLAKLLLLAALAWLLVRTAYVFADGLGAATAAALIVWATPTTRFRFLVRPHVVGMLLAALYLHGLLSIACEATPAKQKWRWVGALGLCHVLWVNLHGSHLLGLALTTIFAAASLRTPSLRKPFSALVGLELVASCVSPYGPRITTDAVAHVLDPAYRELVGEWAPLGAQHPTWIAIGLFTHIALGLVALPGLRRSLSLPWAAIGSFGLLAVMGIRSVRFVAEAVLLITPLVAIGLAQYLTRVRERNAWIALGTVTLAVAATAVPLWHFAPPHLPLGFGSRTFARPAASAAWLAEHLREARVFSVAEDGWFTLFAAPGVRVYMDSRFPFHGVAHSRSVQRAFASPHELQRLLERYDVDAVLLQHSANEHRLALATVASSPDYALVVVEQQHALFVRGQQAAPLEALRPGYDPASVLGASVDRAALGRDLAKLAAYPNASSVRDWVRGLLALEPALAEAGHAGPRPPTPALVRSAAEALARLEPLAERVEPVATVFVYTAMAAVAACRLDAAERWLDRAAELGESREQTLLGLEVALRRGRIDDVRGEVERALATPGLGSDAWLVRLRTSLASPPRCP